MKREEVSHLKNFQGYDCDKADGFYPDVISKTHLCSLYQTLFCIILTIEAENGLVKLVVMTTKSSKKWCKSECEGNIHDMI